MKAEFVNAFLTAFTDVLSKMASTQAEIGKPFLKKDMCGYGDVSGLIGLSGERIKGTLAITFENQAIMTITSRMLSETFAEVDDTVTNMAGEIANMVMGSAKKTLGELGYKFELTIPSIVIGPAHIIAHQHRLPVVTVPIMSDAGRIHVELAYEEM